MKKMIPLFLAAFMLSGHVFAAVPLKEKLALKTKQTAEMRATVLSSIGDVSGENMCCGCGPGKP